MMAPRLQQNSILQLTEQDIAQASNPVWGGADWKPGFIMDNSKDRRSGFLTDAGRKTILLKGKSFTDHFLREYHQAFSGETAQSKSVQLTNLSRRLLELGHDLFIWQDPFAAYIQGLVQVTDIAFNSALGNIKAEMPEIGAIKPAGSVENSFESELDPLTSERRAVLKIRNNFTHLEFSDINGEVSKVPFRASLEYDYVFVPGSDSTQRGSYQLRFPIIIRGEDAQLCRGIITQSQLSDGIKDEIIARYQKGIKH
ncbi:MAG: hypothetical protein K0Q57_934, partial [Gammaproteobacteria bacterium]|nr:hypothetical protein [Gammaproteobacteria bacterium]